MKTSGYCTIPSKRAQSGLSLVELLIALAISGVLLTGVIQIYLGSSSTNRVQEGLSRVQEGMRFALDDISRSVRMAGHTGCPRGGNNNITVMGTGGSGPGFGRGIEGVTDASTNGAASDFWSNSAPGDLVAGEPAVRIQFAEGRGLTIDEDDIPLSASNFEVTEDSSIEQNATGIITDCTNSFVFERTDNPGKGGNANTIQITHGGSNNSPHNWNKISDPPSNNPFVLRQRSFSYYIANNDRGNPSLYRRDELDGNGGQELVENVQAMELLYGVTNNPSQDMEVDEYVAADSVTDWEAVIAVRIAVLVQSEPVLPAGEAQETEYSMLGQRDIEPDDRRVRQLATTTVSLRNRIP